MSTADASNAQSPSKGAKKPKKPKKKKEKAKEYWWCYILRSTKNEEEWLQYVGMTNEVDRRIL